MSVHRPSSLEDAHAAATSVTQAVLDLRAQLESRDGELAGLRVQLQSTSAELVAVREDAARLDDLAALEEDVQECNKTINRHLTFIDRLIKDKTELRDRCEDLVNKLKTTETKYATRFKVVQGGREVELKRQKDILAAAEKLRREKWVKDQTRKIKEMTIKGMCELRVACCVLRVAYCVLRVACCVFRVRLARARARVACCVCACV